MTRIDVDAEHVAGNRPGRGGILLFGAGDFACNLYWQSVTLYLLFFYTDVLGLPPTLAGLVYMAGAIWDGLADLAVGAAAQRPQARYRRFVGTAAVPLGLLFVLVYLPPLEDHRTTALLALAAQLLFRTFYALVNVPYAAWSARFSPDARDRTMLAGARMLFGAGAATIVALGVPWVAQRAGGAVGGWIVAASLLSAVATPVLLLMVRFTGEPLPAAASAAQPPLGTCLRLLARNRAFVTLNIAMAAAGMAAALLNQSVLYYFRYVLDDAGGGPAMLATMAIIAAAVVPVWTWSATRIGGRATWLTAAAGAIACTALFALAGGGAGATRAFLIVMQAAFVGFNLAAWALLPNTVEFGEVRFGVRVEALAFGVSALLQKGALAAAALVLGSVYDATGYVGGGVQGSAAIAGIHWLMVLGPAAGVVLAAAAMLVNPQHRGAHAANIARLASRREREPVRRA